MNLKDGATIASITKVKTSSEPKDEDAVTEEGEKVTPEVSDEVQEATEEQTKEE
jgi:hypothetical protein